MKSERVGLGRFCKLGLELRRKVQSGGVADLHQPCGGDNRVSEMICQGEHAASGALLPVIAAVERVLGLLSFVQALKLPEYVITILVVGGWTVGQHFKIPFLQEW